MAFIFLLLLSFPEATPVQERLLITYIQFAISGVNYHSYGGNRGRRRGVIWGSDWGVSEMPRSDWPIALLASHWSRQRPGEPPLLTINWCTWDYLFWDQLHFSLVTIFSFRIAFLVHIPHVAGAWTERQKMFLGGSFLKLADDNKYIKNPEAQNRALRGFWENRLFLIFPHEKTTFQWSKVVSEAIFPTN